MRPTLLRYVVPLCLSRDRATHPERKRPSERESAIDDSQHTIYDEVSFLLAGLF